VFPLSPAGPRLMSQQGRQRDFKGGRPRGGEGTIPRKKRFCILSIEKKTTYRIKSYLEEPSEKRRGLAPPKTTTNLKKKAKKEISREESEKNRERPEGPPDQKKGEPLSLLSF